VWTAPLGEAHAVFLAVELLLLLLLGGLLGGVLGAVALHILIPLVTRHESRVVDGIDIAWRRAFLEEVRRQVDLGLSLGPADAARCRRWAMSHDLV